MSGFDSQTQNVKAKDLDATTIIDFSKMENGIEMFEAFRDATTSSTEKNRTNGWSFTNDYKGILTW